MIYPDFKKDGINGVNIDKKEKRMNSFKNYDFFRVITFWRRLSPKTSKQTSIVFKKQSLEVMEVPARLPEVNVVSVSVREGNGNEKVGLKPN